MNILRTKSVEQSIKDTEEPEFQLRKELGPLDLIVFGIGVIVGTGIFVLTGVAAATRAGPAIALSFVVAGTDHVLFPRRFGPRPGGVSRPARAPTLSLLSPPPIFSLL